MLIHIQRARSLFLNSRLFVYVNESASALNWATHSSSPRLIIFRSSGAQAGNWDRHRLDSSYCDVDRDVFRELCSTSK
jgi:hypothetical protein